MEAVRIDSENSAYISRDNLAKIKLVTIAGPLLCNPNMSERASMLLSNRARWGREMPLVMIAVHNEQELKAADRLVSTYAKHVADFRIVQQKGHNETVGNAIGLFREYFDQSADPFTVKRQSLFLTRRGGKGKPKFISPFTGGQGTTCGEWTHVMSRKKNGTILKGFMKASVAVGFCPVGCPYCYLNMPYTDGMDVSLNWEDLKQELLDKWIEYRWPINFGETSGLVEYDEWFVDNNNNGSMVQYIIDACSSAKVTPFFLTKIRYPAYLKFHGKVQTGISLMPEDVRVWLAPNGSPTDELLESLAWTVFSGAVDPVVRLTVIWQQKDSYPELLTRCKELLGKTNWRLTLDILRFTPTTASIINNRYPKAAGIFASELDSDSKLSLSQLAKNARGAKKLRPSEGRQAKIYTWFRDQLNNIGCSDVILTPCKGDASELLPLVRKGVIKAMPCACYGNKL